MGINERILAIMAHFSKSKSEFAAELGISQGVLSHLSSGRNKAGLDLVVSVLTHYPDVSPEWLLLERGEMIREKDHNSSKEQLLQLVNEVKMVNDLNYNSLNQRIESIKSKINDL